MSRREPPFKPGEKFQNYQLRRLIGSGGQGFVYEAYDEHLDHVLAVKIVPTNTERASDLKQRARMEARILFRVRHRNIVEFHNAAATDDGMVWIQGTLRYMSPEHLHGRTVTEQSDIFALGVYSL